MENQEKGPVPALMVSNRSVGPMGIMLNWLLYDDEDLQTARMREGGDLRVDVFLDPKNIGAVLAWLPDGSLLKLPARRSDYAAHRTLAEHRDYLATHGAIPFISNFGSRGDTLFWEEGGRAGVEADAATT